MRIRCVVRLVALVATIGMSPAQGPLSRPAAEQQASIPNDGQKRVLALYPTIESSPSVVAFDREYVPALNEALGGRLEYYREYMDTGRVPATDDYLSALRAFLRTKYQHRPPHLVLAYSMYVAEFVEREGADLFPGTPVLFFSSSAQPVPGTVVTTGGDFSDSVALALTLQPRTKQVFVVSGASDNDRYYGDFVRTLFQRFEGRVQLTYLAGLPLPELKQAVARLPRDSIIYFVIMAEDGAGRRFDAWSGLDEITSVANAPVYVGFDSMLGHGVVGGRVWTAGRVARPIAEVSVRLLRGEPRERIPSPIVDPYTYLLDWRQLKRWRIDERLAPAGTRMLFRQPTAWELYHWYILGAIALLGLQGALILSLVVQRSRRRETEARNVAILRAVPDMMFLLTRDGIYLDVHASDPNRLLAQPERFLGKHMRDVLPAELAERFLQLFARLAPGQTSAIIEYALPMPEGDCLYEARVAPVQGERVLAVVRDITERRRAEAALQDAQDQLRRASRLGALGEFAATIAHEIRQPLTAIIMNARSCLRGISGDPPNLEDIRAGLLDLVEASQRADEVIQRNRRLFRDHAVDAAPLDINALIRDTLALAGTQLADGQVTVTTSLSDGLPAVSADRIELQQVVLNLIGNAIDALGAAPATSRRMKVSSWLDDQHVRVAVSDNGVGLGSVDVRRLFTLSYTTKATGSGVGLSISRSIIEAHGGRLSAEQNAEGGATFWFAIPAPADAITAPPTRPYHTA